jgi:ABC-type multidrug transport system fused ATPase/permease subunit
VDLIIVFAATYSSARVLISGSTGFGDGLINPVIFNQHLNTTGMEPKPKKPTKLTIRELLTPHVPALAVGLIAVVGEGIANLLEPWPLKIVLDGVLRSRPIHGWLNRLIQSTVGEDKVAVLKFACVAVIGIAALDAVSSYTEKYFTTSVAQWVTHDLRRILYSHIQRLSLAYHDQKRSGDLLSGSNSCLPGLL